MANVEMEDARSRLAELRRLLLASITDEQKLYQRYSEASREADRWRRRAELAASRAEDDLARAALERSARYEARASEHHLQYLQQKTYVEQMKARLLELEASPRRVPVVDAGRLDRSMARVRQLDERAAEQRARLAALAELERDEVAEKLAVLEREDRLDRQLAELKAKLGVGGPGPRGQG